MQKITSIFIVLAFVASYCKPIEAEVTVFDNVVKSAKEQKFDYVAMLEKARKGDEKAIKEFFDFSRFADGLDGFDHATTCLELMPKANDVNVAKACSGMKPSLKRMLLERLAIAQSRTKKPELQSPPFEQQFPLTFAVLNEGVQADTVKRVMKPINLDSLQKAKDAATEAASQPQGEVKQQ